MNAEPRKFELLNYVWLEGFVPYYFEGENLRGQTTKAERLLNLLNILLSGLSPKAP